jgi:hypothetical protein
MRCSHPKHRHTRVNTEARRSAKTTDELVDALLEVFQLGFLGLTASGACIALCRLLLLILRLFQRPGGDPSGRHDEHSKVESQHLFLRHQVQLPTAQSDALSLFRSHSTAEILSSLSLPSQRAVPASTMAEPSLSALQALSFSVGSIDSSVESSQFYTNPSSGPGTPSSASTVASDARKALRPYRFSTQCATVENPEGHRDQWGSSSVPIYQTATFKGMGGQYDYTRSGNPTRGFLGACAATRVMFVPILTNVYFIFIQNTTLPRYRLLAMPLRFLPAWALSMSSSVCLNPATRLLLVHIIARFCSIFAAILTEKHRQRSLRRVKPSVDVPQNAQWDRHPSRPHDFPGNLDSLPHGSQLARPLGFDRIPDQSLDSNRRYRRHL